MKKSSQMIEWLKESRFAIKTTVNHMFWVRYSDVCRRNGELQTIGKLCNEIINQLNLENRLDDDNDIQDWYYAHYFPSQNDECCIFTQLPPIGNRIFDGQFCSPKRLAKIKNLLMDYKSIIKHHHSGKIHDIDGILSWLHLGTGLQWTTFSYLQSNRSDYAEILNDLCYAGHTDWRIPTIQEIRVMLSADKEMLEASEHPLVDYLPMAMPLPVEQTPSIHPSDDSNGYYVFEKECTATTGTRYNREDERIDYGGYYIGSYIAVRGELKLQRNFQTAWAGTLLQWTEKNMTLVEQGQLPASSRGWKKIEVLTFRGEHFKNDDYIAACAAMTFLDKLKEVNFRNDKFFHEIPAPFYNLSQVKVLHIWADNKILARDKKQWSITYISSDIKKMINLEKIILKWNFALTRLPDEIFDLPNLTTLRIGGCFGLIFSKKQAIKICDLVMAGVYIDIPILNLRTKNDRVMFLKAVEENGGEIDINTLIKLFKNSPEN